MVIAAHKSLSSEAGLRELPTVAGVGGIRLSRRSALHIIWKSRHWPFFHLKNTTAFVLIPVYEHVHTGQNKKSGTYICLPAISLKLPRL